MFEVQRLRDQNDQHTQARHDIEVYFLESPNPIPTPNSNELEDSGASRGGFVDEISAGAREVTQPGPQPIPLVAQFVILTPTLFVAGTTTAKQHATKATYTSVD